MNAAEVDYRPRLLDLFCCAGGATKGYQRAGFRVTGVDLVERSDYCGDDFIHADVMALTPEFIATFAAAHASPPCQAKTNMSNRWRGTGGKADTHPELIGPVRYLLLAAGVPYVLENVPGAKRDMRDHIVLTGGMFGLGTHRPRLFETNWLVMPPPKAPAPSEQIGVYGKMDGRRLWTRSDGSTLNAPRTLEAAQDAMGMRWVTEYEAITEAIPPAYTEWIGRQLVDEVERRVAA